MGRATTLRGAEPLTLAAFLKLVLLRKDRKQKPAQATY
jgi:hypothetical protein